MVAGELVDVDRVIYVEPNVQAQMFWLKNRQPELWKDKVEVQQEITAAVIDRNGMKVRYDGYLDRAVLLRDSMQGRGQRLNLTLDGEIEE